MTDNRLSSGGSGDSVPQEHYDQTQDISSAAGGLDDVGAQRATIPSGDGQPQDPSAEKEIWAGRTHWKHYAGRLILWVAGNIALVVVVAWLASRADWLTAAAATWIILAVFAVSGILIVGRVAYKVLDHRYRLTTQRIFIARGILSQTVDQTELIRVDDVRLHKSFMDRILGLGTVTILSTDTSNSQLVIEGIADAEKVAEAIRTRMRAMRQKSLFIENL